MATIRTYLGVIGFCAAALVAPRLAHATGEACTNDIDCKTGTECGGEICDWTQGMTCHPATATGSGQEGWCTLDTHCKCKAQGATCTSSFQCTKTLDGTTAAGGGSATGGGSGTAGTTSSSGGTTSATGGTTSATGGTTSATGGTTSGPTGTSAAGTSSSSDDSSSSSGCGMAGGAPRGSLAFAFGAACALGLAGARRRRRAA